VTHKAMAAGASVWDAFLASVDALLRAGVDPHARRGLRLQHEPASAGLDPAALGGRNDLAGSLGVIFRDDLRGPTAALGDEAGEAGEAVAWVCAALGERWPGVPGDMSSGPGSTTSAAGTLLHRSEGDPLLRAITSAYPTPMLALRHYVELLVPPALRLCTAHGVALEMHLQNTLVVHRGGRLCGFIVRDLGGIRIHRGRLTRAGHAPDLAAGSFTVTADLAETQTKLAHTLLHAHLGTVFAWAADLLGADEAALWAHTRAVIEGCLAAWAQAQPQLAEACAQDRAVLLAPVVQAKALLRMRIDERISDYAYTRVSGPFAP
ncbi:MAG TPA: ferric iron reductase, partial [Nannocystis sp.]